MPFNTDFYLNAVDKLNEAKALKAKLEFKLDQAALRVQHYAESIEAIDKFIRRHESIIICLQKNKHINRMAEIDALGKRLGL